MTASAALASPLKSPHDAPNTDAQTPNPRKRRKAKGKEVEEVEEEAWSWKSLTDSSASRVPPIFTKDGRCVADICTHMPSSLMFLQLLFLSGRTFSEDPFCCNGGGRLYPDAASKRRVGWCGNLAAHGHRHRGDPQPTQPVPADHRLSGRLHSYMGLP